MHRKLLSGFLSLLILVSFSFATNQDRKKTSQKALNVFKYSSNQAWVDGVVKEERFKVQATHRMFKGSDSLETKVYVPDSVFRQMLVEWYNFTDLEEDSVLREEAESVEHLWLSGSVTFEEWDEGSPDGDPNDTGEEDSTKVEMPRIQSLEGINAFRNLYTLIVEEHELTTLNIDSLKMLGTLSIYENKLTSIDFSAGLPIYRLNVVNNPFAGNVDFSALEKLEELYHGYWPEGENTNITAVDVSSNMHLREFYMNQLPNVTSLDLSNNPGLQVAWIGRAGLSDISFADNHELREVFLEGNNLSFDVLNTVPNPQFLHHLTFNHMAGSIGTVDLHHFPNLGGLELIGNNLTDVDLTPIPYLWYLNLDRNMFSEINLDGMKNLHHFKIRHNSLMKLNVENLDFLEDLEVDSNMIEELFLPFGDRLRRFSMKWNNLKTLDIAKYRGLDWWRDEGGFEHPGFLDISMNDSLHTVFVWKVPFTFEVGELHHDDSVKFVLKKVDHEAKVYIPDQEFLRILIEEYQFTDLGVDSILVSEARRTHWLDLGPWRWRNDGGDGDNGEGATESSKRMMRGNEAERGNIFNLRGIEAFKNLNGLNVEWNRLSKINLSELELLEWVNLNGNNIDTIDITKNMRLRGLHVLDNPLKHNLNVSHLMNLEDFWIGTFDHENPNTNVDTVDVTKNMHLRSFGVTGLPNVKMLDLSGKQQLHFLLAQHLGLESVNLQGLEELFELHLSGDSLTVDLSQLPQRFNLERLSLGGVQLGDVFDGVPFERLRQLSLWNNGIKAANLGQNFELEELDIGGNMLDSIAIAHLQRLWRINLSYNHLKWLDLGPLNGLQEAWLGGNQIEHLKLPGSSELHHLDLHSNNLKELDVSYLTRLDRFVDEEGNERGGLLNITDNHDLKSVYVWRVPFFFEVGELYYDEGVEFMLPGDGGPGGPEPLHIDDPAFFKVLVNKYGFEDLGNQDISRDEARRVTALNLDSAGISSLKGIGGFEILERLSVVGNKIGVVDFGRNFNLRRLNISGNRLKNLDLAKNHRLERLNVSNNILEKVFLAENKELRQLDLSKNKLMRVNLVRNQRVHKLNLSYNPIDSVNLSQNISLDTLWMHHSDSLETVWLPQTSTLKKVGMSDNSMIDSLDLSYHKSIRDINVEKSKSLKKVFVWTLPLPANVTVKKDSQTVLLAKRNPLRAEFTARNARGQGPLKVEFIDRSFTPDSLTGWSWDFDGDGNPDSQERNPFFTYENSGQYTVSLTVTDSTGATSTVTKENFVHVFNLDYVFEPAEIVIPNLHRGESREFPFAIKNTGDGDIFFHDVKFPEMDYIHFDVYSKDVEDGEGGVLLEKDSTIHAFVKVYSEIDIFDEIHAEVVFLSTAGEKSLKVTLNGSDRPFAQDDELRVVVGQVVDDIFGFALENDSDPDGDPIGLVYYDDPLFGTLKRRELGKEAYYPRMSYVAPAVVPNEGMDNFSYVIADFGGHHDGTAGFNENGDPNDPPMYGFGMDTAKIRIFVHERPEFVRGTQQQYTVLEDQMLDVSLYHIAAGIGYDGIFVEAKSENEALEALIIEKDGRAYLQFKPEEGYNGQAMVKLEMRKPKADSGSEVIAELWLTVVVVPVDEEPPVPSTSFHFSTETSLAQFITIYNDFSEELYQKPEITVDGKTTVLEVQDFSKESYSYKTKYTVEESGDIRFKIYAKDLAENDTTVDVVLNAQKVPAGQAQSAQIDDDLTINFKLSKPMYFFTERLDTENKVATNIKNESMERLSVIYKTKASQTITSGVSFKFDYKGSQTMNKVAVYRRDIASDKWVYVRSLRTKGQFETTLKDDGEYALFYNEKFVFIPEKFTVYQNYPNPFNPTTTLRFDLPEAQHVKVFIYNVLGQKIRTLVNGQLEAGVKEFIWDSRNDIGTQVSSGIYFYRILTGNKFVTKKMVLLK